MNVYKGEWMLEPTFLVHWIYNEPGITVALLEKNLEVVYQG